MTDFNVLLAFDFGMKRIGVAIGTTVTSRARALTMLPAINGQPDWHVVKKLIQNWHPDALIVGIPLNMDGTTQTITEHAKKFAMHLKQQIGLPILEVDERLTSVAAREDVFQAGGYKALKKTQIDSVAAQIILQNWLDNCS